MRSCRMRVRQGGSDVPKGRRVQSTLQNVQQTADVWQ